MAKQNQSHSLLTCPYCSTPLKITFGTSTFGVLVCDCDSYPIIEGIPVILKSDTLVHKKLVELIRSGHTTKSVWTALGTQRLTHRVTTFLCYLLFKKTGILLSERILYTLLYCIGPSRSWFKYLLDESRDTLQTISEFTKKSALRDTTVLDIGCGTGSFLKLLETKMPKSKWSHIGIDKSYMSLLIAQLYRNHAWALFICSDLEVGLPLHKSSCDYVYVIDCFAWIYAKEKLVGESHRVLKKKGSFYMFNVHEELDETKWWGYGIREVKLKKMLLSYFSTYELIGKKNKLGYSCTSQKK